MAQSRAYKKRMNFVYGIGAAVVIVGAMFKIQHWPGASIMLIGGLGIEAVIFMLSAHEPLHEEIDWTIAYPELALGHSDSDHNPNQLPEMNKEAIKKAQRNSVTVTRLRGSSRSECVG